MCVKRTLLLSVLATAMSGGQYFVEILGLRFIKMFIVALHNDKLLFYNITLAACVSRRCLYLVWRLFKVAAREKLLHLARVEQVINSMSSVKEVFTFFKRVPISTVVPLQVIQVHNSLVERLIAIATTFCASSRELTSIFVRVLHSFVVDVILLFDSSFSAGRRHWDYNRFYDEDGFLDADTFLVRARLFARNSFKLLLRNNSSVFATCESFKRSRVNFGSGRALRRVK